jgi:predicted ATPase/DNA-binding SARP family transcriptional activator
MRYGILGGLELEEGGRAVRIGPPKQRALLLCLLIRANEVVSADELVEALWGAAPPRSARKLVQVYVSQLRRFLDGAPETRSPGYVLHVEADDLDAWRFERLLDEAREALSGGNAALAGSLFRRALALWRGPALHDVAYEAFAQLEARRLEELRLVCIEGRLAAELELGRHEAALPELEVLVEEQPLREELRRLLMLALYRSGRQADALAEYRRAATLLRDELGLAPGGDLRALEAAILNQDPALVELRGAPPPLPAVPVPASSLVGREDELAQLATLVGRREVRIVTVNGAGGSGKTRVALELARRAGPTFANGAAFVELAPLTEASLVIPAVGQALGFAEAADESRVAALGRSLRDQELLLVLDNFEHVIDAAAEVAALVSLAPRLTVLVTSRRVLHISGEHVFPLQPLSEADATRLFVERAAARGASLKPADEEIVLAICARLDALPLAIELAAARTATTPIALLLDRLSSGIAALGSGPRDAPARQQTLADTLAWSTDLLGHGERRALSRLSVFRGGCLLQAAEAVAAESVDEIEALIDSSLLQRAGDGRLTLLETVREHAAAILDESGERSSAEAAHADYFVDMLGRLHLKWPEGERDLSLVDREIDNLRAAYDESLARGEHERALSVATMLFPYWWVRGHFLEGRERIRPLIEFAAEDGALQARALHALAALQWLMGDAVAAGASAAAGVEVGTCAQAFEPVSYCHTILGILDRDRGEYEAAAEHFRTSGELAEGLGNPDDVRTAQENLADLALVSGRLEEARSRWEWVIAQQRGRGMAESADCGPRLGLGQVAFYEDRLDDAERELVNAYELAADAGFRHICALAVSGLAAVAAARGDAVEAALVLGRASELLAAVGGELKGSEAVLFERARADALDALGEERLQELGEEGRNRDPRALSEHTFPSDPPG